MANNCSKSAINKAEKRLWSLFSWLYYRLWTVNCPSDAISKLDQVVLLVSLTLYTLRRIGQTKASLQLSKCLMHGIYKTININCLKSTTHLISLMSLLTTLNKSSSMLHPLSCRLWTYISTDRVIKQKEHTW